MRKFVDVHTWLTWVLTQIADPRSTASTSSYCGVTLDTGREPQWKVELTGRALTKRRKGDYMFYRALGTAFLLTLLAMLIAVATALLTLLVELVIRWTTGIETSQPDATYSIPFWVEFVLAALFLFGVGILFYTVWQKLDRRTKLAKIQRRVQKILLEPDGSEAITPAYITENGKQAFCVIRYQATSYKSRFGQISGDNWYNENQINNSDKTVTQYHFLDISSIPYKTIGFEKLMVSSPYIIFRLRPISQIIYSLLLWINKIVGEAGIPIMTPIITSTTVFWVHFLRESMELQVQVAMAPHPLIVKPSGDNLEQQTYPSEWPKAVRCDGLKIRLTLDEKRDWHYAYGLTDTLPERTIYLQILSAILTGKQEPKRPLQFLLESAGTEILDD